MQWRRALFSGPHDLAWWTAWAFMVGAALFALGSFPPYSQMMDPGIVGITFAVGSVFFTSAGYGQFVQVLNDTGAGATTTQRYVGYEPGRVIWWAVAVQLAGTVLFNVNTFAAMIDGLSTQETNRLVWAPDVFGSAAFLIASHLAWLVVCGRLWCVRRESAEWWTAAVNYLGSIFFGISAIASLTLPTTGNMLNTTVVNSGTFAGALCFVFGAYLLLPPAARTKRVQGTGR
jgi:hypothetical protein